MVPIEREDKGWQRRNGPTDPAASRRSILPRVQALPLAPPMEAPGLTNPLLPNSANGSPNNLTERGLEIHEQLIAAGGTPADVLYYVAGVFNSSLAAALLEEIGPGTPLAIRIPTTKNEAAIALRVARYGRAACALCRALYLWPTQGQVKMKEVTEVLSDSEIEALGFRPVTKQVEGYKPSCEYELPSNWRTAAEALIANIEEAIDEAVEELYQ